MFLVKAVLNICSKFTGEHSCQSVISIKLQSNFIEITLRHGCSPLNLLHIFRTAFTKNNSGWLLLNREMVGKICPNVKCTRPSTLLPQYKQPLGKD